MLGLHCSQKPPAASRIFIGFDVVAGCQQQKLSTTYPQDALNILGMVVTAPSVAKIAQKVRISAWIVAVQRCNTRLQKMFAGAHKHKRGEAATGIR
jgi:hypothetical protein